MTARSPALAVFVGVALATAAATAAPPDDDGGFDEDALFGDDSDADSDSDKAGDSSKDTPTGGTRTDGVKSDEDWVFSEGDQELIPNPDPLTIGGMLYLRPTWAFTDSDDIEDHSTSMPNLLEIYLDGRPSDRLRAYARGRLTYDPTVNDDAGGFGLTGGGSRDQVSVALDQLWLNFDIERVVYVTIGATQVRWGASRLWNPIDVVNSSRRDPLEPFDDRTGIPVVKLHFPIEALGWNFYLLGMLDRVDSIEKAGMAARMEVVALTSELGITTAVRDGVDGKFGFDWSIGIANVDITGELGITFTGQGPRVQLTSGVQYTGGYGDDDFFVVGAEYFFNQLGSDSVEDAIFSRAGVADADGFQRKLTDAVLADPTPDLFSEEGQAEAAARASAAMSDAFGGLEFFYVGRHYAAMFASLPGPGTWDDGTVTASTIGNLSDKSFIARLDVSWKVLTYLTLQAFVQVHFGRPGELNFGPEVFEQINEKLSPFGQSINFPAQIAQIGLWLRLDI